ncbi:MAG: adenylosuccinate synthase [Eubacteriales bacterium]
MGKGKSVVVIGACWGDEGKGKITNYLGEQADVVVRFSGGDNAGHTIVFDGNTYKLHIVPSGIFKPSVVNILGNGCVINPKALLEELDGLKAAGFACENLYISDRANVLFDYHRTLDGLQEEALGARKIGTTKKGIGPCYTDKIARTGIRMCDFVSADFREIYRDTLTLKNDELTHFGGEPIDFESSYAEYQAIADRIRPMVTDTITMVNDAYNSGKKILMEGAQGTLLDIDFGTYPFVTSSNPSAGGVSTGTGLGPTKIDEIVGITKAYTTRVGEGPFPTELNDRPELAQDIRDRAGEYGATTKRPRRIGWYDAVIMKYSCNVNGFTGLSMMLLDILSGIKKLKICDYYTFEGEKLFAPKAKIDEFARCEPHYIEMDGWDEDITGVRSYEELPVNCRRYIEKIEELLGVPVIMFSVGPDKYQTIVRKELF